MSVCVGECSALRAGGGMCQLAAHAVKLASLCDFVIVRGGAGSMPFRRLHCVLCLTRLCGPIECHHARLHACRFGCPMVNGHPCGMM